MLFRSSTLDLASILTATQSPLEKCPEPANISLPDLSRDPDHYDFSFSAKEQGVLDFLNTGGNPSDLITALRQTWKTREVFTKNEVMRDLTGDGVPEILIIPSEAYIFGCHNQLYEMLLKLGNDAAGINYTGNQLVGIQDMNLDGIPEIVVANFGCGGFGTAQCLTVYVFEWKDRKSVV